MHNGESDINCQVLYISWDCHNKFYTQNNMVLKYLNSMFCQPQMRSFDNYSFRNLQNKKLISCIQAVCEMDMAYPWKMKQNFYQHMWLQKIEEAFPQSSIADWKSTKSSILMKYEINIMKIHLHFIY